VLASCQLNIWGPGGDFVGRTYVASDVSEGGVAKPLVAGTELTLTFTKDGISASAGCNSMVSTDAGIDDSVLRVSSLISTQMACDPAVMQQEDWWADFLTSGPAADVGDRVLTLTSPTAQVRLTAEETVEDLPLTGTAWKLDTIVSGEAASSVPAAGAATLGLTDHAMTITVGTCRKSTLPATIADTTIGYDTAALAASTCTGEAAQVDRAILAVFGGGSVDYRIDGTRLTIGSGGQQLVYTGA
jgi:heat shock protein HslJ